MPIHDWTRVPAGLFHDFHQTWSIYLKNSLNLGLLPKGLSALVEQRAGPMESDVLTVESRSSATQPEGEQGRLLTLERPVASIVRATTKDIYAAKANRIVVKHHLGRIVAVIEILSPGNKDSRSALRDFVAKSIALLQQGIHLLIVDLFPPTPRDPFGIHKAIWDEILEEDFVFPKGKDRILVSYENASRCVAFIEPVAVGDALPSMPLFLISGMHVRVPLEQTYQSTWEVTPEDMRMAVETGVLPEADEGD